MKSVHGIDFTEHLSSDSRDYWWHDDYLKLLAARLHLNKVQSVLDVGCGQGHWTQKMASVVSAEATLIGVDQNEVFLRDAAIRKGQDLQSFLFQKGDAYTLDFPNAHFDLVTCQTLLVHLDQPRKAVNEMLRVLKKGGRLLLVEPNNLAQFARANTAQSTLSREETLDLMLFYMLVEDGKKASENGQLSAYWDIPQMLAAEGLKNIDLYTNDRAGYFVPPYDTAEQKTKLSYILSMAEKDFFFIVPPESTAQYFNAISDDDVLFKRLKAVSHKLNQAYIQQIKAGTFHGTFGCQMFVATGIKP